MSPRATRTFPEVQPILVTLRRKPFNDPDDSAPLLEHPRAGEWADIFEIASEPRLLVRSIGCLAGPELGVALTHAKSSLVIAHCEP
jgi:hypothetical protein